MADDDLAARLQRRIEVEEGKGVEKKMREYRDPRDEFAHPYPEFSEFTREQCAMFEDMFAGYDENKDDFICYDELKAMMEKRGTALTHLELKKIISTVDEDQDGKFNFREFMLFWIKCVKGDMPEGTGYDKIVITNEMVLAKPASVEEAGLGGAKAFFETKGKATQDSQNQADEILREQRKKTERKRQAQKDKEAAAAKKAEFAKRAGKFE